MPRGKWDTVVRSLLLPWLLFIYLSSLLSCTPPYPPSLSPSFLPSFHLFLQVAPFKDYTVWLVFHSPCTFQCTYMCLMWRDIMCTWPLLPSGLAWQTSWFHYVTFDLKLDHSFILSCHLNLEVVTLSSANLICAVLIIIIIHTFHDNVVIRSQHLHSYHHCNQDYHNNYIIASSYLHVGSKI